MERFRCSEHVSWTGLDGAGPRVAGRHAGGRRFESSTPHPCSHWLLAGGCSVRALRPTAGGLAGPSPVHVSWPSWSPRTPRMVTSSAATSWRSASPATNPPSSRTTTTDMRREGRVRSGSFLGSSVVAGAPSRLLRSWRSLPGMPGLGSRARRRKGHTESQRRLIDSFGVRGRGRPPGDLAGRESPA